MSTADTSIYRNILPRSVAEYEDDLLKVEQGRQSLALNKLAMTEKVRAAEEQNALRSAVSAFGQDPTSNYQTLLRTGNLPAAQTYQKSVLDAAKAKAEAAKTITEHAGMIADRFKADLPMITNQAQMAQWLASQYAHPTLGPIMAQRRPMVEALSSIPTDPVQFEAMKMKVALGMKEFSDAEHNKATLAQTISNATATLAATTARDAATAKYQARQAAVAEGRLKLDREKVDAAPKPPKPPKDMRYTEDGSLEPIPGSVTDKKRKDAAIAAKNYASAATGKLDVIEQNVDRMLESKALGGEDSSNWLDVATGIRGVVARRVPGSEATGFEARKETILANLGFKELADMRAQSPTGGALGNVTEKELQFLQATVASLNAAQNDKDMKMALQDIKKAVEQSRRRIKAAEIADTEGAVDKPPQSSDGWSIRKK